MKVLAAFGTRPEAIKLAPVIAKLRKHPDIETRVCITAQHREMLDQVLELFGIVPDIDLDLMVPNQTLSGFTSLALTRTDAVLAAEKPDVVLVQGDTTTVMITGLAAFYRNISVGHVEAGLRSGNIKSPFPEEMNRRIATLTSTYHFAPTQTAKRALLAEGIHPGCIFLTGNTVIDALRLIAGRPMPSQAKDILRQLNPNGHCDPDGSKLILVTAHRRENFGRPLERICMGLKALVERNKEVVVIYPVHLNPNVQEPVNTILGKVERVRLIPPVEYHVLVHLMKRAYLILTDSGGIQEEAPALGKPVLVLRTETERPEGIRAGTAKLVGPFAEPIVAETELLLQDSGSYERMARAVNPYGDGRAAERIVKVLLEEQTGRKDSRPKTHRVLPNSAPKSAAVR